MSRRLHISGGRLKGRALEAPPGMRPTAARVRESLMDIWQERLPGARFLDLFAGSGAVGLEAVSRGAALAVLVEGDRRVARILRANCAAIAADCTRVLEMPLPAGIAARWPRSLARDFELVFADPPYAFDGYARLLDEMRRMLGPAGEIALEHGAETLEEALVPGLRLSDRRRYGDSCLSFFQRI